MTGRQRRREEMHSGLIDNEEKNGDDPVRMMECISELR